MQQQAISQVLTCARQHCHAKMSTFVVDKANLGVDNESLDASCIITPAYQPCLLQHHEL